MRLRERAKCLAKLVALCGTERSLNPANRQVRTEGMIRRKAERRRHPVDLIAKPGQGAVVLQPEPHHAWPSPVGKDAGARHGCSERRVMRDDLLRCLANVRNARLVDFAEEGEGDVEFFVANPANAARR